MSWGTCIKCYADDPDKSARYKILRQLAQTRRIAKEQNIDLMDDYDDDSNHEHDDDCGKHERLRQQRVR